MDNYWLLWRNTSCQGLFLHNNLHYLLFILLCWFKYDSSRWKNVHAAIDITFHSVCSLEAMQSFSVTSYQAQIMINIELHTSST